MTGLRRQLSQRLSVLIAGLFAIAAIAVILAVTALIHRQVDAELESVALGSGVRFLEEAEYYFGIDWDEEVDGPNIIDEHRVPHEPPLLGSDFEFVAGAKYEWLIRDPSGAPLAVTAGFPSEVESTTLGLDETEYRDVRMPDGSRGRLVGVVLKFDDLNGSLSLDEARRLLGPRAKKDWRTNARPGFDKYRRFELPIEILSARPIAAEEALLRRAWAIAGVSWVLASLFAAALTSRIVGKSLRTLGALSRSFARLDARTLSEPIAISDPVPDELVPLVEEAERSRGRLESALERERRFSSDAAHELLTPLAGMRAMLEVASAREDLPSETRASLERSIEVAGGMTQSVEALLDLAGASLDAQSCDLEAVDVGQALVLAREQVDSSSSTSFRVRFGDEPTYRALVHPTLLDRVLVNVLKNARVHGTVGHAIDVAVDAAAEHVRILVENDIENASKDLARRAGDLFWRAEKDERGTERRSGIGLTLASDCARAMGGDLQVAVEDGRFLVTIVLRRAPAT